MQSEWPGVGSSWPRRRHARVDQIQSSASAQSPLKHAALRAHGLPQSPRRSHCWGRFKPSRTTPRTKRREVEVANSSTASNRPAPVSEWASPPPPSPANSQDSDRGRSTQRRIGHSRLPCFAKWSGARTNSRPSRSAQPRREALDPAAEDVQRAAANLSRGDHVTMHGAAGHRILSVGSCRGERSWAGCWLRQPCHDRLVSEVEQRLRVRGEPIRVAVVDDHEVFRRGLTMLLALEADMEVVGEAGDGIAAIELAASTAPDVILMDVRMPKRSGIEACVAIKEVAPTARIIMLAVSDEEADLYDAVKNGALGYLLKESSLDEVAQAVRVVADGQSLISPSMAIKLLDEFKQISGPDRQQASAPRVTDRELGVLRLVAQGLNNREIGERLFISENTVKNHVRNILEKLQLHSRMEAAMYAVREKLIDMPDPNA